MIDPERLSLCSGTLLHARSLREKLEAASGAGFRGVSLWYQDYLSARAGGLGDADIRSMLDGLGLRVHEMDSVARWLPGGAAPADASPVIRQMLSFDERELLAAAAAIGAHTVIAIDLLGIRPDPHEAAAAFARLCDRAGEFGLAVGLEFMPFSGIPDLATGLAIVERAGRENGGLNVDAWHLFRSNSPLDLLDRVDGRRVKLVQLSDAPARPPADIATETGAGRLLPGQGDINLPGLLRCLDRIGTPAPIGIEIFSDALRALPPRETARLAMQSTRAVLERAFPRH
ncbi:MAG: sugar phosphate isomerase/epimerase family protein [Gammaproteobacteria bacterium]